MRAFTRLNGLVALLDRASVDTDAIIPKQFLKLTGRRGFGRHLFDSWRYLDAAEPGHDSPRTVDPDFVLNAARYADATILLTRENFGCGSSREHAVWALTDYGFEALIAPGFADIFYGNCFKNGLLPIVLEAAVVDRMMSDVEATPGYRLQIDLDAQTVVTPAAVAHRFAVDAFRKQSLLNGLDDVARTLGLDREIRAYELRRRADEPWLFE